MKKNIILGAIAGLCLASVTVQADTMSVAWGYPGAPATATIRDNGNNVIQTFKTFCLEDSEFFSQGYKYNYTIDGRVIYGGPNATGNPPSAAVSAGAVNLYLAYFSGAAGLTAQLVQEGIWWDQGYTAFASAAATLAGLSLSYVDTTAYSGPLQVSVYNLYTPNNGDGLDNYGGNGIYGQRQSFIRIPDGGTTIILLGAGLLGLGLIYRRFSVV